MKWLANGLIGILLYLDGIVYWLISLLFDLYEKLAGADIFADSGLYEEISQRFLVVIGVFMLFYLAYSLLRALVNPDELSKNTSKIVINIAVSLILLNVVPVIFNYAFELQNIIIGDKVISKFVFGNGDTTIASVGKSTALTFFDAFIEVKGTPEIKGERSYTWDTLKICIEDNTSQGCVGNESFRSLHLLSDSVVAGDIEYTWLISTLCGGFLVYVIASFCIDLGIRVVKLGFYQIISPIPILLRIIPEKKSVFDNWVKATLATYLEVFIRLFIMYLITYIASKILSIDLSGLGIFGTIVVLMGIYAFGRQAPKLIGDVIGINAGNIKLGIRDKLATGGAFAAGALIGGAGTTFARNLTHGFSNLPGNVANAQGIGNKFKASFGTSMKTFGSAVTGAASGAIRSGYEARNAKNFTDMRNATNKGIQTATDNRNEREAYRVNHATTGVMRGHATDLAKSFGEWAGVTVGEEGLKKQLDIYTKGADFKKQLEDLALKKNTKAKLYDQQIDALNKEAIDPNSFKDANGVLDNAAYSAAISARASQIDQLRRAKNFEVMKTVSEKLNNIDDAKNVEFKQIVNSFETYKKQNANMAGINDLKDITNTNWDSSWNNIDAMSLTQADFNNIKNQVSYTSNHETLNAKKNETAAKYAEHIQKAQEKK